MLVFGIKYLKTRQGLVQGYVPVAVFSDTYCQIQVWAGTTPLSNDLCNGPKGKPFVPSIRSSSDVSSEGRDGAVITRKTKGQTTRVRMRDLARFQPERNLPKKPYQGSK